MNLSLGRTYTPSQQHHFFFLLHWPAHPRWLKRQRGKQITSPGWVHETSAQGWCTGMTQRDGMEREAGGGFRMGNTCKSMADSCQYMAKTTTIL